MQQYNDKPGVLVVDDEHAVRTMVQLALEYTGFEVWVAGDGREAIRVYQTHGERIALVLLDVRIPILDGPHTLDALRELNPDVVACFMSGDTGKYASEDLLRRGAASVFAKPFRLGELASQVHRLAQGASAVAACQSS